MTPISSSVSQGAPQIAQKPPQVNPFSYNCDQCSYNCWTNNSLIEHKRTTHNKKFYICSNCNKNFATAEELQGHNHNQLVNNKPQQNTSPQSQIAQAPQSQSPKGVIPSYLTGFVTAEELRAQNPLAYNQSLRAKQDASSQSQIAQGPQSRPSSDSLASSGVGNSKPLIPLYLLNNSEFKRRLDQLSWQLAQQFGTSATVGNPECVKKVKELVQEFESVQQDVSKVTQSTVIAPESTSIKPPRILSTGVTSSLPADVSLSFFQSQPSVEKKEQASTVSSPVQQISDGKQEEAPVANSQAPQTSASEIASVGSLVQAEPLVANAKRAAEEEQGLTCNICLELFKDPKDMTTLKCGCEGYYHLDCLKSWWSSIGVKGKCPLCSKEKLKTADFATIKNFYKRKKKK